MRNESRTLEGENQEINLEHIISYEKFMDADAQAPTSILTQFFRKRQMKKIILNKGMMKVEFAYRRPIQKLFRQNSRRNNLSSEVISIKSKLAIHTEQLREVLPQLLIQLQRKYSLNSSAEAQFQKWIGTKNGNLPFWTIFFTIMKQGPSLKYIVFSKKLLQILGYEIEEAALYFRKYKQTAISFSSNQLLKQTTFNLLAMLKQVGYLAKNLQFTDQNITQSTQKYTIQSQDILYGKDDLKVVAETKVLFQTPQILYTQLTKIISKERQISSEIYKMEKQFYEQDHTNKTLSSLSSIIQFPQSMHPINVQKICSYKQILIKDSKYKS